MNKTVNINLAGIFFHIDEDAYSKLQRYLEAIKRSFTDSQGRSEIISDIEARIAELFADRIKHDKQVIGNKEVEEVITIMGQPEDYLVDDEIFEDEPVRRERQTRSKKLFRDTDNSYIGGVTSGLGHYLGIDAIWVRLIWILLTIGSGGTFIIIYILFWILVPEALSTSDKLVMTGEPVNISNIEKKIKDGFDGVSDVAKNVTESLSEKAKHVSESISDGASQMSSKHGSSLKSTSKSFFDTIGDIFMFFLKIFAKFIGFILMLSGAVSLIALAIGLSISGTENINVPGLNLDDLTSYTSTPLWLILLLVFFTIGIPLLMLVYLGLKILITNLKSIGTAAKLSLLGLWLISLITLIVLGARQGLTFKEEASVNKTELVEGFTNQDTLNIRMVTNDLYTDNFYRNSRVKTMYDGNDKKIFISQDIRLVVKSTTDSIAKVKVYKSARGIDYLTAKKRAEKIIYHYDLKNNELSLDNYFNIPNGETIKNQEVMVILYLPEGSTFRLNKSTKNYLAYRGHNNTIASFSDTEKTLRVVNSEAECLDCPEDEDDNDDDFKIKVNVNDEDASIKIDDNGLEIKTEGSALKIDDDGVKANSENVKVNIDDDGIEITSEKKEN